MIGLLETAMQVQEFCDRQGWRSCVIGGMLQRYSGRIDGAKEFALRNRVLLIQSGAAFITPRHSPSPMRL